MPPLHDGGRTSSISWSFSRLNGLMNVARCSAKPSCKSSVSRVPYARTLCRSPQHCVPERQAVRSGSLKCCQEIALVGRLHRQHGAPSVNGSSDLLDRYSRFADRHMTELREGLQQQHARYSPHCAGDEVTRPYHLHVGYRSRRINENVRIEADHRYGQ